MENSNAQLLAFYGVAENVGKNTLSLATANALASSGKKVLFVEGDYLRPGFTIATGLSHELRNMLELAKKENEYNLLDYICKKTDIAHVSKNNQKVINKLNDNLDFLTFPKGYNILDFPNIKNKEAFASTFIESLSEVPYDYVVISVPNELSEILSYTVLYHSNIIVNILGSSPRNAIELKETLKILDEAKLTLPKMLNITNMINEQYISEIEELSNLKIDVSIPFDYDRSSYEWGMQIGSPIINEKVLEILLLLDVQHPLTKKEDKKGFFNFR